MEDVLLEHLKDTINGLMFGNEQQRSFYNGKLETINELCRTLGIKKPFEFSDNELKINLDISFQKDEQ